MRTSFWVCTGLVFGMGGLLACSAGGPPIGRLVSPPGPVPEQTKHNIQLSLQDEAAFSGSAPMTIAAADVDQDGHMDVLFSNRYSATKAGQVDVWFGKGQQQFKPPVAWTWAQNDATHLDTDASLGDLQAVDLNNDTFPDWVAVAYEQDNTAKPVHVQVWMNQKNRTVKVYTLDSFGEGLASATQGDVNHDGNADVVVYHHRPYFPQSGRLHVYLGHGDGTFATPIDVAVNVYNSWLASSLQMTDVNRDGDMDLVAVSLTRTGWPSSLSAVVWMGHGDGTFAEPLESVLTAWQGPFSLVDVNQDGVLDVAMRNQVFLGKTNGTFVPDAMWKLPELSPLFSNIAMQWQDMNRDGTLDLVWLVRDENSRPWLRVYTRKGLGGFALLREYAISGYPFVYNEGLLLKDLNSDAIPEMVVAQNHLGTARVGWSNTMTGQWDMDPDVSVGASAPSALALVRADELVFVDTARHHIASARLSEGTFSTRSDHVLSSGWSPSALATGDLDQDGRMDVVAVGQESNQLRVLQGVDTNEPYASHLQEVKQVWPTGSAPSAVAVVDWNKDGLPDVLVAQKGNDNLSIYVGREKGRIGFETPLDIRTGPAPLAVKTADVDGDGFVDAVVVCEGDGHLRVVFGGPNGSVVRTTVVTVGGTPVDVAVGDVTGDGKPDIVVTDTDHHKLWLLKNEGKGTFLAGVRAWQVGSPHAVQLVDVNHDGSLDLAVTDADTNQLLIVYSTGDGAFVRGPHLVVGRNPTALAVGFLNDDAYLDFVVSNSQTRTISTILSAVLDETP